MGTSTFSLTGWATLIFAAIAGGILVWFILRRPALDRTTKIVLLFGIGLFPIGAATFGNVHGYEETKTVGFCGGCHVMTPYTEDVGDPHSVTLASLHGRNETFGKTACYECHADYGMFGAVTTKVTGMKHMYLYLTEYRDTSIPDALPRIQLYHPYPNINCMKCHSTKLPGFADVPEHMGLDEDLRSGKTSCASEGCHGPAHPFAKPKLRPIP